MSRKSICNLLFIFLFISICINFISAEFGYDNPDLPQVTPTLEDWIRGIFDSIYCKLTGCNIKGNLNVTGNITGNFYYGEMWGHDIGDLTIGSSNVYYNITNLTSGELNGFTHSAGILTPQVGGIYSVILGLSFGGSAANEYHVALLVNGIRPIKCHSARKIGTGADVGAAGFSCLIRLNASNKINVAIENTNAANDASISDINLNLVRVGN